MGLKIQHIIVRGLLLLILSAGVVDTSQGQEYEEKTLRNWGVNFALHQSSYYSNVEIGGWYALNDHRIKASYFRYPERMLSQRTSPANPHVGGFAGLNGFSIEYSHDFGSFDDGYFKVRVPLIVEYGFTYKGEAVAQQLNNVAFSSDYHGREVTMVEDGKANFPFEKSFASRLKIRTGIGFLAPPIRDWLELSFFLETGMDRRHISYRWDSDGDEMVEVMTFNYQDHERTDSYIAGVIRVNMDISLNKLLNN